MNNPDHLKHLARAFDSDAKARGLLEDIGYPMENAPPWTDSQTWWRGVIREIELGRIENGMFQLYGGASRQYPGNPILAEAAAAHAPAPEPAFEPPPRGGSTAPPVKPGLPPPTVRPVEQTSWPTLTLVNSERHDDFIRAVRRLDPGAQLCYGTQGQACVSIGRGGTEGEEIGRRVAEEVARWGDEAQVDFREYRFQPYALREIVVYGPDGDGFRLNGVPSTMLVRDIAIAVLQRYDDEAVRDRRGRFVRTAIDLIQPDGTARRLNNPDQTLHEAGVPDGAHLQLVPEATAGSQPVSFRESVLGAERQITHYASEDSEHFHILDIQHKELPTKYLIEIKAAGFAPPAVVAGPVEGLRPEPIDLHRVTIELLRDFPQRPPLVFWQTPIFHPNIRRTSPAAGLVCLGALMDAYRPGLDLGDLCRMLVDIAAYRNYEVLRPDEVGGEGYLDEIAATWARSAEGQRLIEQRGGKPRTDLTEAENTEYRIRPLEISAWDTWDDDY